jgi:predicted lipoprotein with Yx(FWY)xxD motif
MVAAALATCVIGVAACGGGSSNGSTGSSGGAAKAAGGAATTVKISKTDLGQILTDGQGRTLYLFEKDKGPKSTCFGACAAAWPPLTATAKPNAAGAVAMSKLTTVSRSGGAPQVTYAGHPLYYYAGDTAAGQTTGEGLKDFGAGWYALSASGKKVDEDGS